LSRNEDENMVVREGASRPSADVKASVLEDLKKPLPLPPKAPTSNPNSVAVKPQELPNVAPAKPVVVAPPPPPPPVPVLAAKVPEGPPSRDPPRMDTEGFIRYWLVLAPLPSEKEKGGAAEILADRLRG